MSQEIQILPNLEDNPICLSAIVGLDLVEVGKDEVTLRLGKQANRRQLQFALQSLVAVFGKCLGSHKQKRKTVN